MDTTVIKQEINDNVKTNGVGAITGQVLNETLNDIVDAVTPQLYDESTADERVTIETEGTVTVHGGETVFLKTAGWRLKLSEEEGFNVNISNAARLHLDTTGFSVAFNDIFKLEFSGNEFRVELNDGEPVVLKYDIYNGLQVMGGLRVGTITLDGVDLSETLLDLQRQIDELKNQ